MKGLAAIPSTDDLSLAYAGLQGLAAAPGTEELALWSQWSRLDPRLGELWVAHLAVRWNLLAPMALNAALLASPWPAAAGPLLEQVPLVPGFTGGLGAFRLWKALALTAVRPASGELFFLGTRAPGSLLQREDARLSFDLYRRWGYLARELLLNKAPRGGKTLLSWETREAVLAGLAGREPRFNVRDYERALGGWVGRRQAERDLKRFGLRARGRTRARAYSSRKTGRGPAAD